MTALDQNLFSISESYLGHLDTIKIKPHSSFLPNKSPRIRNISNNLEIQMTFPFAFKFSHDLSRRNTT
jgi:hypothetical protein